MVSSDIAPASDSVCVLDTNAAAAADTTMHGSGSISRTDSVLPHACVSVPLATHGLYTNTCTLARGKYHTTPNMMASCEIPSPYATPPGVGHISFLASRSSVIYLAQREGVI